MWFYLSIGGNRNAAELEIIGRCFYLADTNGDGKLSRTEFRDLLKSAGMELDHRQASRLFSQADTDKSGSISFEEFRAVCERTGFSFRTSQDGPKPDHVQLSSLSRHQVMSVRHHFARCDSNRDGRLTTSEFSRLLALSNMTEKANRRAAGLLRNGSISFREFLQLFSTEEELDLCVLRKLNSSI